MWCGYGVAISMERGVVNEHKGCGSELCERVAIAS